MPLKTKPLGKHCGVVVTAEKTETLAALRHDDVISCFKQNGAVIFSGFGNNADMFTYFTEQFTQDFLRYEGGAQRYGPLNREQIGNNETLLSTSGGKLGFSIPLHGELYYWNSSPEIMWFYCDTPPAANSGGQTTICDGTKAYQRLKPQARDYFAKNQIKYIRTFGPGEWQGSFFTDKLEDVKEFCEGHGGTFELREDGSIVSEFVTSALKTSPDGSKDVWINNMLVFIKAEQSFLKNHGADKTAPLAVRMADNTPVPEEMQKAVLEATEPITQEIAWNNGDIAMIDNRWILHGRRKAQATSGRAIFVRMGKAAFAL